MINLTGIKIENFKCFKEAYIPIKPLTLIYGKNSAGKSSIFDALLLAAKVLKCNYAKDFDETFVDCVYKHDVKLDIILTFEITFDDYQTRFYGDGKILKYKSILEDKNIKKAWVKIFITNFEPSSVGKIAKLELGLQDDLFFVWDGGDIFFPKISYINLEHTMLNDMPNYQTLLPLFKMFVSGVSSIGKHYDNGQVDISHDLINNHHCFSPLQMFDSFKSIYNIKDQKITPLISSIVANTEIKDSSTDDIARAIIEDFAGFLNALINKTVSHFRDLLDTVFHLGPLREIPTNDFNLDVESKAEGLSVMSWLTDDSDAANNFNGVFVGDVNEWLVKLDTGYAIKITDYYTFNTDDEICKAYKKYLDKPNQKKNVTYFMDQFNDVRRYKRHISLIDIDRDIVVSPSNVGVGISQVLPVIIQTLIIQQQAGFSCIEQPELHLHPALQAELGDLFIKSRFSNSEDDYIFGGTTLLETHSEHILLRIMRRIRESTNGVIKNEDLLIKNSDVMILYVESIDKRSIVREMPLNEHGELIKAWPGGFFEEGLREVF